MRCNHFGNTVYVDLNLDQLAASVGIPFAILIGLLVIGATISAINKQSEKTLMTILVPLCGACGGMMLIAFIIWLIQTWGDFVKWFKYC